MNLKYVLAVVFIKAVFCDNKLQRKTRSTLSAPLLNTITADFEEQDSPENYFPDVEYPTNILDVAKPYYFKAADKVVLEPFPKEVKDSFKFITSGGKIHKEASPDINTEEFHSEEGNLIPVATNKENSGEHIVVDHTSVEENLNVTEVIGN